MAKTLVLYCDDNAEHKQCLVTHPESVDIAGSDLHPIIPDLSDGGSIFLVCCDSYDGIDRPDVTNGYGEEVPCTFAEVG